MERIIKYVPYILLVFFFVCIFYVGFIYFDKHNTSSSHNINDISFNCSNNTIKVGENKKLDFDNKDNLKIEWSSSDQNILIVNDGAVQGLIPGSVTVTMNIVDLNVKKECQITVVDSDVIIPSIDGNVNGDTNSNINNNTNNNQNTNTNQNNNQNTNVDQNTNQNDNNNNTNINTNQNNNNNNNTNTNTIVEVASILLNKTNFTMEVGDMTTLVAKVLPDNATNKDIKWSSSNSNIITVSNGVVTAKGVGKANVIVSTTDGKKKVSTEVVVKEKSIAVTDVSLNKNKINMTKGKTESLSVTVLPSNATNKNITWVSSDKNIVTVSNGVVTAESNGAAIVTAKSNNGKSVDCLVVVGKPTLSISKTEMTIIDEKSRKLTTSLSFGLIDQSVTWTSSDTSVAKVDSNGNVTGKSVGTATITATSNYDSSIKVKCVVTVRAAKVLFIGNSKTYYPGTVSSDDGIPKRFKAIAKNRGYTIEYTQAVIGGVALNKILDDSTQSSKIKRKYDYVIVNEGTDRAYNNKSGYYDDINTIKKWTVSKNENVAIYVRKFWLRIKKDSNGNPDGGSTAAQIRKSYENAESIANELGLYTINDGPLFYDMMDNSSIHIMKYQDGITTDLTHQNATGAYLAALCMYAEVYDKDPTKVTYNGGIKETTANTLKSYAKKHCYNN